MHPGFIDLLLTGLGHTQHSGRGRKMAEALEHEKVNEHGKPIKCLTAVNVGSRKSRQAEKQRVNTTELASLDEDDHDYQDTEAVESESTSPSESNCQGALPSNEIGRTLDWSVSLYPRFRVTYVTCALQNVPLRRIITNGPARKGPSSRIRFPPSSLFSSRSETLVHFSTRMHLALANTPNSSICAIVPSSKRWTLHPKNASHI